MIVKASVVRSVTWVMLCCEFVGITVIAYAFLTPLPMWSKLLITGGVTYLAMIQDASVAQRNLARDRGLQSLWLDHLSLRMGINSALEQMRNGKPPLID